MSHRPNRLSVPNLPNDDPTRTTIAKESPTVRPATPRTASPRGVDTNANPESETTLVDDRRPAVGPKRRDTGNVPLTAYALRPGTDV